MHDHLSLSYVNITVMFKILLYYIIILYLYNYTILLTTIIAIMMGAHAVLSAVEMRQDRLFY